MEIPTSLIIIFKLILTFTKNKNQILIFYENSTQTVTNSFLIYESNLNYYTSVTVINVDIQGWNLHKYNNEHLQAVSILNAVYIKWGTLAKIYNERVLHYYSRNIIFSCGHQPQDYFKKITVFISTIWNKDMDIIVIIELNTKEIFTYTWRFASNTAQECMIYQHINYSENKQLNDSVKTFVDKKRSLIGIPLTIHFTIDPPNVIETKVRANQNLMTQFIGTEIEMCELIAERMSAKITYRYLPFPDSISKMVSSIIWLANNESHIDRIQTIELGLKTNKTKNTINRIKKHILHLPSVQLESTAHLYPYKYSRYYMVAPNIQIDQSAFGVFFRDSPIFRIWLLVSIIYALIRFFLQYLGGRLINTKPSTFSTIYFDTLGRSIGTTAGAKMFGNRSETILLLSLSIFSILASIFCSGFLFNHQLLATSHAPLFNSIPDVEKSSLDIYLTHELSHHFVREYQQR